jgi:hypothetical protein
MLEAKHCLQVTDKHGWIAREVIRIKDEISGRYERDILGDGIDIRQF